VTAWWPRALSTATPRSARSHRGDAEGETTARRARLESTRRRAGAPRAVGGEEHERRRGPRQLHGELGGRAVTASQPTRPTSTARSARCQSGGTQRREDGAAREARSASLCRRAGANATAGGGEEHARRRFIGWAARLLCCRPASERPCRDDRRSRRSDYRARRNGPSFRRQEPRRFGASGHETAARPC